MLVANFQLAASENKAAHSLGVDTRIVHDIGIVDQSRLSVKVDFKNSFPDPITCEILGSSCGCIVVQKESFHLEKSEHHEIEVLFHKKKPGAFHGSIILSCSAKDGNTRTQEISLKGWFAPLTGLLITRLPPIIGGGGAFNLVIIVEGKEMAVQTAKITGNSDKCTIISDTTNPRKDMPYVFQRIISIKSHAENLEELTTEISVSVPPID